MFISTLHTYGGDGGCSFWQPVQADSQPKSDLVLCRRPLGAILRSSNEPGELSQLLCRDDSTINIVVLIIIIMYHLTAALTLLAISELLIEYCILRFLT